jgi:hypothetical protein
MIYVQGKLYTSIGLQIWFIGNTRVNMVNPGKSGKTWFFWNTSFIGYIIYRLFASNYDTKILCEFIHGHSTLVSVSLLY